MSTQSKKDIYQKRFNELCFELSSFYYDIEKASEFIALLNNHGNALELESVFYRLGCLWEKSKKNSQFAELVNYYKTWVQENLTPQHFRDVFLDARHIGIKESLTYLMNVWPEFCFVPSVPENAIILQHSKVTLGNRYVDNQPTYRDEMRKMRNQFFKNYNGALLLTHTLLNSFKKKLI